ncbi:hypothetical protein [Kordia sp.]|uniref:hypothetical protein n=1 Tax=Kordia sp. TaxID=1965332 RepID=UPI003D6C19D5
MLRDFGYTHGDKNLDANILNSLETIENQTEILWNVRIFEKELKELFVQKSVEFIENRIKRRASLNNLPNRRVFLFENLDKKTRTKYASQINRKETGKIILLFTDRKKNWTAIGTKMIVGYDGEQVNSVAFNNIKDWQPKKHYELGFLPPNKRKKFRINRQRELLIFDKEDNRIVFITRRGNDFWELFNLVEMLQRLNK